MRRMVAVALMALAAAACGSAAAAGSSPARFAGYKWSVVAIRRDGRETPVPARYNVYLQFAPNGQYGANDPVNYHLGTYRATGDGFATGHVATTLAGSPARIRSRCSRWPRFPPSTPIPAPRS